MPLTPAQLDQYWSHGFVVVPRLFSAEHLAALRVRLEELCREWQGAAARAVQVMQEPGLASAGAADTPSTIRKFSDLAREEPLFYRHARSPALLDVVEQLLGLPLVLYADQAMLKPPRHGSEKPEHQDNAHFLMSPAEHVITCWAALDDADLENGCLHYYPGSHLLGLARHRAVEGTPHLVLDPLDRAGSVPVPVHAGDCVLHHSLTVHWSPANASGRWRRAYICHYARADAHMGAREPNSPPLLEMRA